MINLTACHQTSLHFMTSKWKGHHDSGRKHNKTWEETHGWVAKALDGTENAFCKLCRTSIQPRASNLANHEKSEKHVRRIKDASTMRSLQVVGIPKASLHRRFFLNFCKFFKKISTFRKKLSCNRKTFTAKFDLISHF